MKLYRAFITLLFQDLLIVYRSRLDFFNPILFFVLVVSLFPLTMGAEPNNLMHMAPGIIWIASLFSIMLSFENLFHPDFEDGSLEQLILNPNPLPLLILAKLFSHWLVSCLPLIILSVPMGIILYLSKTCLIILVITLLIGTPSLYLIGAIASALTLGLKQKGFLMVLLVVPLYIPILIFATTAVTDAGFHLPYKTQLTLLTAIFTLCISFAPLVISAALRISTE